MSKKDLRVPSKSIREIITAVLIFVSAAGLGVVAGISNKYRWIGLGVTIACIIAIIALWATYVANKKKIARIIKDDNESSIKDETFVPEKDSNIPFELSKNFTWVFEVPEVSGSSIQFATDKTLKAAIECCDQARADINYIDNLEKYKDIELNNINIYIRKVLEWALKFVKFNDPLLNKKKTFFTVFDGKKVICETEFAVEKKVMDCKWTIEKHEDDVYTYSCVMPNNKKFYLNSFKKYIGDQLITYWKKDDTTGAPFINKWASKYPDDNKMKLIQDVCLDIYKTTSKVIHSSEDTRKMINVVYAKYYDDINKSDQAKALLVAKAMFHQVRFVLWYVAYKYTNYNEPFKQTDSSVYRKK